MRDKLILPISLLLLFFSLGLMTSSFLRDPVPAWAQQRDSVTDKIINDGTADPQDADVPAANSIGQLQHTFVAIFDDAPSQTCSDPHSAPKLDLLVQGSMDGGTYFPIESKVISMKNDVVIVKANGYYPFIRGTVSNWDNTNCIVDIFYSGTVAPDASFNTGLESGISNNLYSLRQGYIDVNGAASQEIDNSTTFSRILIYGITLYNGGSTATDVQLESQTAGTVHLNLDGLCAGCGMVWPITGSAYVDLLPGDDLLITSSAAGGDVGGWISYRVE